MSKPVRAPVFIGACSYCDFTHESGNPIDCNMAIIRHKCDRKYARLDPYADDYDDQLRARGIPASDKERDALGQ